MNKLVLNLFVSVKQNIVNAKLFDYSIIKLMTPKFRTKNSENDNVSQYRPI